VYVTQAKTEVGHGNTLPGCGTQIRTNLQVSKMLRQFWCHSLELLACKHARCIWLATVLVLCSVMLLTT